MFKLLLAISSVHAAYECTCKEGYGFKVSATPWVQNPQAINNVSGTFKNCTKVKCRCTNGEPLADGSAVCSRSRFDTSIYTAPPNDKKQFFVTESTSITLMDGLQNYNKKRPAAIEFCEKENMRLCYRDEIEGVLSYCSSTWTMDETGAHYWISGEQPHDLANCPKTTGWYPYTPNGVATATCCNPFAGESCASCHAGYYKVEGYNGDGVVVAIRCAKIPSPTPDTYTIEYTGTTEAKCVCNENYHSVQKWTAETPEYTRNCGTDNTTGTRIDTMWDACQETKCIPCEHGKLDNRTGITLGSGASCTANQVPNAVICDECMNGYQFNATTKLCDETPQIQAQCPYGVLSET